MFNNELEHLADQFPVSLSNEELQRTEKWRAERAGKFTGSVFKKLMTCTTKTSKLPWSDINKITDFSDGAIKEVFRVSFERMYGYSVESVDAVQFKYGRIVEPYIKELLTEFIGEIQETGFIDIIPGVCGASPDGIACIEGDTIPVECKAAMTTSTLYERQYEDIDQTHTDFWQLQSQMKALEVSYMIYATSIPPKSIQEVLNGGILSEQIKDIKFRKVYASSIHINALMKRVEIGNKCANIFIRDGGDLNTIVADVCMEYRAMANGSQE